MDNRAQKIIKIVSDVFECDIYTKSRAYKFTYARVVAYTLLLDLGWTRIQIAKEFKFDHSNIIHALNIVLPSLKFDTAFNDKMARCKILADQSTKQLTVNGHQKKCYIAGKVSGLTKVEYRINFEKAEKIVKELGFIPLVPIELPHIHDKTWESYMKECIAAMMQCHSIYMLSNYKNSPGALLELELAEKLNFEIIYEQNEWRKANAVERSIYQDQQSKDKAFRDEFFEKQESIDNDQAGFISEIGVRNKERISSATESKGMDFLDMSKLGEKYKSLKDLK